MQQAACGQQSPVGSQHSGSGRSASSTSDDDDDDDDDDREDHGSLGQRRAARGQRGAASYGVVGADEEDNNSLDLVKRGSSHLRSVTPIRGSKVSSLLEMEMDMEMDMDLEMDLAEGEEKGAVFKPQPFKVIRDKDNNFSCQYCSKKYQSMGALKMHVRTHTLPCQCKICGKSFSRPWLLQGHIRTHTGEKPFKCDQCHRAFADRSNLRAHLQTHAKVKKYSCKCCLKTFSRMSLQVKHEEHCNNNNNNTTTINSTTQSSTTNGPDAARLTPTTRIDEVATKHHC